MNGGNKATSSSSSLAARRTTTPSSSTSASTSTAVAGSKKRSTPPAITATSSSNARENACIREVPVPSKELQKKTKKLDRLHMVQRLSSKSLKRYQRYYKLKPKHTHTVLPEIAKHFDGLHVDEKDVVARFLQTLKQAEREKRRK